MFLFHGVHPKKISAPALILTLLFTALAGSLLANSAAANPVWLYLPDSPPSAPSVTVTWQDTNSSSTFSILVQCYWVNSYGMSFTPALSPVKVYVDGALRSEYPCIVNKPVSASLEGLQDGLHSMVVTVEASGYYSEGKTHKLGISKGSSDVINFVLDNNPPIFANLSAKAGVVEGDIQLDFRVIEQSLSWVGYSIDGLPKISVGLEELGQSAFGPFAAWDGHLMLDGLSCGGHSLVVYAEDASGRLGVSEVVAFSISENLPSTVSYSNSLLAAVVFIVIIAFVALASFGLVAYFVKRNRKRRYK
jgi:hypothetical protein